MNRIVVASVALSSQLATRCRAAGIPVVLFNRSQDGPPLPTVTSDNFSGGREIARFLAAGGHRRIGYIAGWEGASTQRDREAGFRPGCARPAYALTTVRQEASAMVAETVTMLRANIEDPDTPPRHVCLPAVLIPCTSARTPKGWLS